MSTRTGLKMMEAHQLRMAYETGDVDVAFFANKFRVSKELIERWVASLKAAEKAEAHAAKDAAKAADKQEG